MLFRFAVGAFLFAGLLGAAFGYYAPIPLVSTILSVLNLINFVIHEVGHPLFGFFGRFLTAAGGTIFQLLVPLIFTLVAFLGRYQVAVWFFVFWFGQNFIHVSIYIADARAHELELFTPAMMSQAMSQEEVHKHHDWTYLLTQLGLLDFDIQISWIVYSLGVLIMFGSALGAAFKFEAHIREWCRTKFPQFS